MALTFTTADAVLKEDYQPAVREQLNQTNMFLSQIEKNTTAIEGRRAVLALHTSRNSGVGARAEGAALPTAGNQGYVDEYVPLKYNYGRIQISGPVMAAMKSDRGSFIRAVDSATKFVTADLKRDVNRQLYGTSNGVIATCGTTSSSTTVVLAAATSVVQLRQLEVGMVVDIGTVATPTLIASAVTITAITPATPSITISGSAVSTTSADFVFRSGAGGSGASQKELTGLQTQIAATGALFNVDPATTPVWSSYVDANGGTNRSVSENLFEKTVHSVAIAGGADINLFITSDGVHRAFSNLLTSLKRFNDTVDLKGGYRALSISAGGGEKALMWDRDCPSNTAFGVATDHWSEYQMSDWEFLNQDGSVLHYVPGFDAYEAVLFKYHELATDQRNASARISDLTEA